MMQCKLKEKRLKMRMTQEELAAKSGISRPTISLLENGELNNAKIDTLRKIAEALDSKVSDIFLI